MFLGLLTALSPLPRLWRGLAALCLTLALLAPDALALLSFQAACGKQCCRTGAKSCCRPRAQAPNQPAISAAACSARCAARALPGESVSLSPPRVPSSQCPPPTRPIPLVLAATQVHPSVRTIQLFQRPPPPFAVVPIA